MNKILIVEDDQLVANVYRNKFAVEGYQVEIALDGQAGMDTVRTFRPDAVILDLMLPKMTGVELMKQIRAEPNFERTPVIVFSNTYLTNMVQEAWKAGATKCLSKANCSPKLVIEVVRTMLSRHGAPKNGAPRAPAALPAAKSPGPASVARCAAGGSETVFQADLRQTCIESLPATLAALRLLLQSLFRAGDEAARLNHINELYRRVHALTGSAAIAGLHQIAWMCDALEALLKELYEKPEDITVSSLRTVASAIDLLAVLFERGMPLDQPEVAPASILVVDDEAISRRAVTYALERAKLKAAGVEDPLVALNLASEKRFDLIFLDVDMPGMNGFELCAKLRALPIHRKTPVVFVTGLTDFESRVNSTMSGGNDFIAKPFLFMELAVKALVHLLRRQLDAAG
jgi:DNA-binding response OmpR family regulator